ncbi:MAG: bifunctional sugar-1-phosphate nucleotidylyltransferase/acetyltransferase [Thermoplasmatota archaeon]
MDAVILAAGEGKRLRPFTETMSKVMLPVANKPILAYIVDALVKNAIDRIIMVVGYKKEGIMEYFKDSTIPITYVVQEKQLGTAHALLQAKKHITDTFIVLSGDNIICEEDIRRLIQEESAYSLLIKDNPTPSKYGVVTIQENILIDIKEKPLLEEERRFISTGVYKFPLSIFEIITQQVSMGVNDITSIVEMLVEQGTKVSVINAELWNDVVYPWDLIQLNEIMMHNSSNSSSNGIIEKGVTLKGSVHIGEDTKIYSGCYIVGPVVIGKGCEIGPNVCIFPSTAIGDHSVIYPFTEIRNSTIMSDVRIGSHSSINHSILGRGCVLGDSVSTMSVDAIIETEEGFKKLNTIGAMVGDDSIIENHTVLEAGIIIGRKCKIAAMKQISKNITSESEVM